MPTLELLNRPLAYLLLRLVLKGLTLNALRQLKRSTGGRPWHWELNADLSREVILRELCPDFDCKPKLVARVLVDEGVDAERRGILAIDAIVHDEEFSIRWVDRHGLHGLEVVRIDALVEVTIVQNHAALCAPLVPTNGEIVVEDESQLWVALKVTFHLDDSINRRIYNHTICIEQDGELLEDIDKDFIALILFRVKLGDRFLNGRGGYSA